MITLELAKTKLNELNVLIRYLSFLQNNGFSDLGKGKVLGQVQLLKELINEGGDRLDYNWMALTLCRGAQFCGFRGVSHCFGDCDSWAGGGQCVVILTPLNYLYFLVRPPATPEAAPEKEIRGRLRRPRTPTNTAMVHPDKVAR